MIDGNYPLLELTPAIKLIIQTCVSLFCCVVGSWILFGQWWVEIWINICLAKGWPAKTYSLAPGGGVLLAIGIYFIPVPTNNYEWIGQFTSRIQPYWWVSLVIDPFHIMVVFVITCVVIPYLYRRYWKHIPDATASVDKDKTHRSENRHD